MTISFRLNNTFSIEQFIGNEVNFIPNHCIKYSQLRTHYSLFNSKEWISNFIKQYKPDETLLVKPVKCNCNNYVLFEAKGDNLTFLGSPFNDINELESVNKCGKHNWVEVLNLLSEKYKQVFIENIIQSEIKPEKLEAKYKLTLSNCVAIQNIGTTDLSSCVSDKITKLYVKHKDVNYKMYFPKTDKKEFYKCLYFIIDQRLKKLVPVNCKSNNASLNLMFSEFIDRLCHEETLLDNVCISACKYNNSIVAASLFFLNSFNILYYLRCHLDFGSKFSFGLMLDYWSITYFKEKGCKIFDFTRGDESYKYRLGGKDYFLLNILINNER